jgi:hypothetical protein
MKRLVTVALLAGVTAAAAVGWSRGAPPAPSIRIVDVRPLKTSDPNLRDLLGHHVAVRVQKTDSRWRLYVDGKPFDEGTGQVLHTPYLAPGTHWVAAQLRHGRGVWSEPIVLHMPRVVK